MKVSGELSAASPDRLSMASPEHGGLGKRIHNLPYSIDVNQSRKSLSCVLYHCFT